MKLNYYVSPMIVKKTSNNIYLFNDCIESNFDKSCPLLNDKPISFIKILNRLDDIAYYLSDDENELIYYSIEKSDVHNLLFKRDFYKYYFLFKNENIYFEVLFYIKVDKNENFYVRNKKIFKPFISKLTISIDNLYDKMEKYTSGNLNFGLIPNGEKSQAFLYKGSGVLNYLSTFPRASRFHSKIYKLYEVYPLTKILSTIDKQMTVSILNNGSD